MREWLDFFIWSIGRLVSTMFSLPTGLGFSYGHLDLALIVIGIVAVALILKAQSANHDASAASRDTYKYKRYREGK